MRGRPDRDGVNGIRPSARPAPQLPRFHGRDDLRLEEIPEPVPGPGDVLLRVLYAGICGTDVHELHEGPIFTPGATPHRLTGVVNPVVLGHEMSGEVIAVGEGVTRVAPGDLVAVYPLETCGTCRACQEGDVSLCPNRAAHGLSRGHGAFAELSPRQGVDGRSRSRPGSTRGAARSSSRSRSGCTPPGGPGSRGDGRRSPCTAPGRSASAPRSACARSAPASILSDPSERRRAAAGALGFADCSTRAAVDAADGDPRAHGRRGRRRVASTRPAFPRRSTRRSRATRRDGTVVVVAVPTRPIVLDVHRFRARRGATDDERRPGPADFDDVIALMAAGHFPRRLGDGDRLRRHPRAGLRPARARRAGEGARRRRLHHRLRRTATGRPARVRRPDERAPTKTETAGLSLQSSATTRNTHAQHPRRPASSLPSLRPTPDRLKLPTPSARSPRRRRAPRASTGPYAARSANFAYRLRKLSLTVSVGPLRCLARITSASPCDSDSSPL